jgi:hypothetical protein
MRLSRARRRAPTRARQDPRVRDAVKPGRHRPPDTNLPGGGRGWTGQKRSRARRTSHDRFRPPALPGGQLPPRTRCF